MIIEILEYIKNPVKCFYILLKYKLRYSAKPLSITFNKINGCIKYYHGMKHSHWFLLMKINVSLTKYEKRFHTIKYLVRAKHGNWNDYEDKWFQSKKN